MQNVVAGVSVIRDVDISKCSPPSFFAAFSVKGIYLNNYFGGATALTSSACQKRIENYCQLSWIFGQVEG